MSEPNIYLYILYLTDKQNYTCCMLLDCWVVSLRSTLFQIKLIQLTGLVFIIYMYLKRYNNYLRRGSLSFWRKILEPMKGVCLLLIIIPKAQQILFSFGSKTCSHNYEISYSSDCIWRQGYGTAQQRWSNKPEHSKPHLQECVQSSPCSSVPCSSLSGWFSSLMRRKGWKW